MGWVYKYSTITPPDNVCNNNIFYRLYTSKSENNSLYKYKRQKLKDTLRVIIDFSNHNIVVVGASSGIGFSIANMFYKECSNIIISSANNEKLSKAFNELTKHRGGNLIKMPCDVKNHKEVDALTNFALSHFGHVDCVINSAGIYPPSSILKMTPHEWDDVIDTNLKGTANILRSFSPPMVERKSGRFVIISSITGTVVGNSIFPHYAASKAGIDGLVKATAIELAKYNVYINSISPGNIMTDSLDSVTDKYIEAHKKAIPLGRMGLPSDIANTALFLASPLSDFITGQNIIVDGGQTLPESHFLP